MRRMDRSKERGIALAVVAIALVAIFAMIVIAVDVGRFAHTASEVQAIADLAALSGAKSVLVRGAGTAQSGGDTAAQQNTPKTAPLANQLEPAMLGIPPDRAKKRATIKAAISVAPLARAYSRGPSALRKVSGVRRW